MANIKPFKGYFYNSEKVGDISSVLTPATYNLGEDERLALYESNEYNAVRIFEGKENEGDTETSNKYTRAGEYLRKWIADGVLVRDEEEAIYLYEETVEIHGNKFQNLTFVALLEIEELGGNVRTCEEIRTISQKDRYALLENTNADMSMISCLYIEHSKELLHLMNTLSNTSPDLVLESPYDLLQRVWRITDKETIDKIMNCFKNLKLYITDGQTRYTTCLEYRDYMRAKNPNHTGKEPYNYTMVSLIDSNSDGVAIMPRHKMLKLQDGFSENYFTVLAQEHFKVEKIIVDLQDNSIIDTMKKQIQTKRLKTCLAVYSGGDYFYRLTLNDPDYIKKNLLTEKSDYYCGLDTVVLKKLIIEDIFGISDGYDDKVMTSISTAECIKALENGEADVMFVLNPVKVEEIEGVTGAGEKMPYKSLSIFPKPIVGLIINVKDE